MFSILAVTHTRAHTQAHAHTLAYRRTLTQTQYRSQCSPSDDAAYVTFSLSAAAVAAASAAAAAAVVRGTNSHSREK